MEQKEIDKRREQKRQWRKKNKWRKGLSKKLIESILALEPKKVEFEYDKELVKCKITHDDFVGAGVAICSIIDDFNLNTGKNKAAGRAIRAIKQQQDSGMVRDNWDAIPNTWTKKQAIRVLKYGNMPKSFFHSPERAEARLNA